MTAAFDYFSINGVRQAAIDAVLEAIKASDYRTHRALIEAFGRAGWETEKRLLGAYRTDAYKNGMAVEIESVDRSSVIDVLHRDLFRFQILWRMSKIEAASIVTRLEGGEVSLRKVQSDLELYGLYYDVPLLVVGLGPQSRPEGAS